MIRANTLDSRLASVKWLTPRTYLKLKKCLGLLQFLDGQARRTVAGFEGVPGGLSKALKMLEQRLDNHML